MKKVLALCLFLGGCSALEHVKVRVTDEAGAKLEVKDVKFRVDSDKNVEVDVIVGAELPE